MPSAYSACASARRTFAPLVSSAAELSVSSWTISGLSSSETSSVYDAPFERERRSRVIRFLIRLARLPLSARTSSSVVRASRNSSSAIDSGRSRAIEERQLLLRQWLLRQLLLRAIVPAALDLASLSSRPVHSDETLPRRAMER